jgi:hypothetical protein
MEAPLHSLNNLFAQLGLPAEPEAVERFIASHRLPSNVRLPEATFWTSAQAAFLAEEVEDDADWAEVVDQLNSRLHN